MNFRVHPKTTPPLSLSAVTWVTEGLLQNNFHDLFGTGDSFDDFAR